MGERAAPKHAGSLLARRVAHRGDFDNHNVRLHQDSPCNTGGYFGGGGTGGTRGDGKETPVAVTTATARRHRWIAPPTTRCTAYWLRSCMCWSSHHHPQCSHRHIARALRAPSPQTPAHRGSIPHRSTRCRGAPDPHRGRYHHHRTGRWLCCIQDRTCRLQSNRDGRT